MWKMIYPMLIVIIANTFYNICAKSVPVKVNAFGMLTIAYSVAAVLSLILLFVTTREINVFPELFKNNWTAIILGIAVVGLELGYVLIYRAGWEVSSASIVANVSLAIVLLFVGYLLYRENISNTQLAGIAICIFGIYLIAK